MALELVDLVKSFPGGHAGHPAVDGVSLTIDKGSFVSLIGSSGCGKTTTLRMIAGLEFPDSGRILHDGRDVTHVPTSERGMRMMFQDHALFPHMTVGENVAFGLRLPAAIALDRYDFPGKEFFRRVVLLPIVLPGVITGVAPLNFYVLAAIPLSLWTIVLGVGTALICITVTEVFARLQQLGRSQEEAAENLGATPMEVFFRVTLPNISTALWRSALITYAIAFDELAVTYLLTGRDNTLPMSLWSMLRREATPQINAIATTVFAASALVLITGLWLSRGRNAAPRPE